MRCFCARKQLDPERANFVFQGQPCCNFACYAQAELVAKEKNANQWTDGTAPGKCRSLVRIMATFSGLRNSNSQLLVGC